MTESEPFVLVLGMHRSGTSCLAGALECCELFLGGVRRSGRFNAKGYFELAALTSLHDQILAANHGTWRAPPRAVALRQEHSRALRQVIDFYSHHRPCGIKDPRLLLLLEHWQRPPLAPDGLTFVGSFRHPVAVARSLSHRNGIAEPDGLALWIQYNAILVDCHRAAPFPLVSYELGDPNAYLSAVAAIAGALGLAPDMVRLGAFVDATLQHHDATESSVPAPCVELYDYLMAHRVEAGAARAMAAVHSAPRGDRGPSVESVDTNLDGTREISAANPARLAARRAMRWGRERAREARQWAERARHRRRARTLDLGELRAFVLFVGNPRCGTTVVRSLLDAHPSVVLGNEVNVLERVKAGEDWATVVGRIVANAEQFRRNPSWEGYRYPLPRKPRIKTVSVLGDKKAGATARLVAEDILLLDRVIEWSPVPIRVVHCVRNPLDVISTKVRRNKHELKWNIERFFEIERTTTYFASRFGSAHYHCIHLEHLITEPRRTLLEALAFLDLEGDDQYLRACQSLLFDRPTQSRDSTDWSDDELANVARKAARIPHLSSYFNPSPERRPFAQADPETARATVGESH